MLAGLPATGRDPTPIYRIVLGPECHVQMRASDQAFAMDGIGYFFGMEHPREEPPAETAALLHALYLASAERRELPLEGASHDRWIELGDGPSWDLLRAAPAEVSCLLSPTEVAFSADGRRAAVAVHVDHDGGSTGELYVLARGDDGRWAIEWSHWLGIACGRPVRDHQPVARPGLFFDSRWYVAWFSDPLA